MVWPNLTEDERRAIEDMEATGSDRATAIVAATILEERLTTAIKSKLHRDKGVVAHLFRISGPLGSFSAKIDLGFLIGLYGKEAHSDLDAIKEIRNEFAHKLHTTSFKSLRVHDLCKNLQKSFGNFKISYSWKGKLKHHMMFQNLSETSPSHMKDKYVRACQVFAVHLSLFIRKRKPPTPAF